MSEAPDKLLDAYNAGPFKYAKCTMTIASPCVISRPQHGLKAGDRVTFTTTGALPTGLTEGTDNFYYVISTALTSDDFEVSTTKGGSAVNTSGSQSGQHYFAKEQTARLSTSTQDSCR